MAKKPASTVVYTPGQPPQIVRKGQTPQAFQSEGASEVSVYGGVLTPDQVAALKTKGVPVVSLDMPNGVDAPGEDWLRNARARGTLQPKPKK